MIQFLHRVIGIFIKSIILIIYPSFYLAGISACIVSGYIEYEIVENFFGELGHYLILTIVVSLESFKAASIFILSSKGSHSHEIPFAGFVRSAIVSFSVICTLIFCFEKIATPRQGDFKNTQREELGALYDSKKELIDRSAQEQLLLFSSGIDKSIDRQRKLLEEEKKITFRGSNDFQGPRYKVIMDEILRLEEVKRNGIDKLQVEKIEQYNRIDSLEQIALSDLNHAQWDPIMSVNQSIVNTVEVLIVALNCRAEDRIRFFILLITAISLMLTMALEGLIYLSMKHCGLVYGEGLEFLMQRQNLQTMNDSVKGSIRDAQKADLEMKKEILKTYIQIAKDYTKGVVENFKKSFSN